MFSSARIAILDFFGWALPTVVHNNVVVSRKVTKPPARMEHDVITVFI
jgi:hypothetical protein